MIKLLKAGFFRLKKDIIFYLFIFLTIGMAGFMLYRYYNNNIIFKNTYLDEIVNEFIIYIGFFIAIFISIFVGKEHSQGIIRNKIIVGHSRIAIFLSNLIISIVVSIFGELIYLIIVLLIGIPLFGQMKMTLTQFLMTMLNTTLIIISFCTIYNFIAMLCSDITLSTIICIILFIALFILQEALGSIVHVNKYIENGYFENGNKHIISQEPNPNYPGDDKVKQARLFYLAIPEGQAMEIKNTRLEYLKQMPIYSITLIIIINILGIYIFSKKELK